ncbi:MAG TPA: VOC family protein [Myxococcota bacterium]|nr:VOC family protein [Myxococcota bacterium]
MSRARIGNHLKMTLKLGLRTESRAFYGEVLGCRMLASPRPDLDLWEFEGGFILGLFFVPPDEVLSDAQHERATWLEIQVTEPAAVKARLLAFGAPEVAYEDRTRFYFRAPGGCVFRLAPLGGGI